MRLAIITAWVCVGVSKVAYAQTQHPICESDPVLTRVAERFLTSQKTSFDVVKADAQAKGSDVAALIAIRSSALSLEKLRLEVEKIKTQYGVPVRCGIAANEHARALVATPDRGRLDVKRSGDVYMFDMRWRTGFQNPELWIETRTGSVLKYAVKPSTRGRASLKLNLEIPASKIQFLAEGSAGPQVLAERWLSKRPSSVVQMEHDPTRWFANLRKRAGVPTSLRRNALLDEIAEKHSERMRKLGRAVHNAGDGDPSDRLKQGGLSARIVGEVVSRAGTLPDALHGLEESPSHHATLIDKQLTDWGFGVSYDTDGNAYVTVMLVAWPKPTG